MNEKFGLVQNQSNCRQQKRCDSKTEVLSRTDRHFQKGKCWLPAFSPF